LQPLTFQTLARVHGTQKICVVSQAMEILQ